MGNDDVEIYHRRPEPGNSREKNFVTLASLVASLSLVWIIAAAWIGFRDGVLAELRDCSSRHELLSTRIERYYSERDPWIERIKSLDQQREQLASRLQVALDRIRDLELGKRP
jgi:hypothetical protein